MRTGEIHRLKYALYDKEAIAQKIAEPNSEIRILGVQRNTAARIEVFGTTGRLGGLKQFFVPLQDLAESL